MEVKEYLKSRLENCSRHSLTDADQKILDKHGIEEFIFRRVASKKFRKWSLGDVAEKMIREKIAMRVASNEPLRFNLSYGGFKLWRMPTAPEVDWAEFFSIAYFSEYMAPIAAAYRPGTSFNFSSGDIAVTTMNNVPLADVDRYLSSLESLMDIFRPHLVDNMHFKQSRLRDLFENEQEFIDAGEKLRAKAKDRFSKDDHYYDEFRRGAIQNVQIIGGNQDLSKLSEEDLNEHRRCSAEVIEAMYEIPQISEREKEGDIGILATFLRLDSPVVMTGTTRRSTAKFWAGMGILARNRDGFAEYVISPKQWEQIQNSDHEIIDTDIVPLENFKEIILYPKKLDFAR